MGKHSSKWVEFSVLLEVFEAHGWVLFEIFLKDYRVFVNAKDREDLPWHIPVRCKKVRVEYYNRVLTFFREREC